MNTRTRTIVLYTTLAVAVAGAGGLAYRAIDSSGGSSSAKTATRLVSATTGTVSQTVSATGTVQPATSLDLNFANGGVLTAVNVKAGDKVRINQVLATIDPAQAKVALETANANLAAAQQKLTQAQNPAPTPENPAPAVDSVAVAQATAGVHSAQLAVTNAQKALDATTLKAPAAGTISAVNFTVGQTVGGGGNAVSGSSSSSSSGASGGSGSSKAFATLLDLDHMVVKVGFPEADAGKVAAGQPVTISIDSLTGQRLTGTVSEIDTVSTVVSNVVTYNAVVAFDSVPASVKPGMTANVSVVTASRDNVVEVPSAAISSSGGQSTVTVRGADGKDEVRAVEVGLKGDGTTEVVSGLADGDQVVMSVGVVSSNTNRNGGTQTRTQTGTVGGIGGGGFGGGGFGGGGFGGAGPRG
ncbi:MAG TPA: HlyD family efflux transporter periplasmic adaptor subunit [Acidimicrobiia bacterium]|nr:HlyD family efflux transporter periplasmic adaptor subunit [Acidimicrobiia bacterium]